MSQPPLVSIIIPTYNRAHLIGETLDSVLAQTYPHWECIIVDDGSSDNTDEVVGQYVAQDPRFKYYHRPDTHKPGGNGARNFGFLQSQGEYVNWFDSDDLMHPEKLERQVFTLMNTSNSVAFCQWGLFDSEIKNLTCNNMPYFKNYKDGLNLLNDIGKYGGYLPCHSYLVERNIIYKSGLWDEKLIINQDGEFFCRVLINAESIYFIENTYVYYRKPEKKNNSHNDSNLKLEGRIKSLQLIEKHIFEKYKVSESLYVERLKRNIFRLLKKRMSFLRYKYYSFFWKQQVLYKVLRKLNF